ncbi:MAG: hypothetical protein ACM3SS_04515 [Rhodospirillaceae bacterium]
MDLLDELKRQAESQKKQQEAREQDQAQILTSIHEALGGMSKYFTELANSLNVVKPEVARNYVVHGTSTLQRLLQGDYFVRERKKSIDFRDYFEQVTLRFHAVGQQVLSIECFADHATDRLRNYLQAYGLRFETQAFRNDRGVTLRTVFSVLPDVPATITAVADWNTGTIRLKMRNVETIGDAEYCYEPAEVDRKLLDELAKLILGQPNEFRTMGRHQESLRVRIVARPIERAPEHQAQAESLPVRQPESKPGLFGGLKSLWKK